MELAELDLGFKVDQSREGVTKVSSKVAAPSFLDTCLV